MTAGAKHLEITLETQVESVNLAEEMCLRVAEAAGFGEDDCYRIGMSVREGVINAFHYGNQERPEKKIYLAVDITSEKLIIHVLDEGRGFTLADVPDPLAEENLLIDLRRLISDQVDAALIAAAQVRHLSADHSPVPAACRVDVGDLRRGVLQIEAGRGGGAEIVMSKNLPVPGGNSTNGRGGEGTAPKQGA